MLYSGIGIRLNLPR